MSPPSPFHAPTNKSRIAVPLVHRAVVCTSHDVDIVMQEDGFLSRHLNSCFGAGLLYCGSMLGVTRVLESNDMDSRVVTFAAAMDFSSEETVSSMVSVVKGSGVIPRFIYLYSKLILNLGWLDASKPQLMPPAVPSQNGSYTAVMSSIFRVRDVGLLHGHTSAPRCFLNQRRRDESS
ncbi:hypothetical protein BDR05DRAFT_799919 [Suillus weaverae]|nr:hypothetical protein BDR05DRAFT_799919 [Suillus weaverae]